MHTFFTTFVYTIRFPLVVASFDPPPAHDPSHRGYGWGVFKGLYAGWAVTGAVKSGLFVALPYALGVDPKWYYLAIGSGDLLMPFQYLAVVPWLNYLIGDDA